MVHLIYGVALGGVREGKKEEKKKKELELFDGNCRDFEIKSCIMGYQSFRYYVRVEYRINIQYRVLSCLL
jgi:hypothetical protein